MNIKRKHPRRPPSPEDIEFEQQIQNSIVDFQFLPGSKKKQVMELIAELTKETEAEMKEYAEGCGIAWDNASRNTDLE